MAVTRRTAGPSPACPPVLSETSDGVIGGTPTQAGISTVTATVTDSARRRPARRVDFAITVNPAAGRSSTIAEVQGTPATQGVDAASPKVGQRVIVRGVVTGRYPTGTGNLAGFYLQTGGADGVDYDTPGRLRRDLRLHRRQDPACPSAPRSR